MFGMKVVRDCVRIRWNLLEQKYGFGVCSIESCMRVKWSERNGKSCVRMNVHLRWSEFFV